MPSDIEGLLRGVPLIIPQSAPALVSEAPMTRKDLPCYQLRLLGPLELRALHSRPTDDGACSLTGVPLAVFAYLVMHRVPMARADLARLFWPGTDPVRARHGLRQVLSRIRSTLGEDVLVGQDPVSVSDDRVVTDLEVFERALADPSRFEEALECWSGPFMSGAEDLGGWELQDRIASRRSELAALLADAARMRVAGLIERGDVVGARRVVAEVLDRAPGQEALMLDLAQGLVGLDRAGEAIHWLERADPVESPERAEAIREAAEAALRMIPVVGSEDQAGREEESFSGSVRHGGRFGSVWKPLGLAGALGTALLLLGLLGPPSASAGARIWFCSERETVTSLSMDLDGAGKEELLHGAGCPVIPLGDGREVLTLTSGTDGVELRLIGPTGARPLLRRAGLFFARPYRTAGVQDGIVHPTGRYVVLTAESEGPDPLAGPVPGVAGSSGVETYEWDVLVLDLESGTTENLGLPGIRDFDARFTPDGDAVVFVSDRTGGGDLYRYALADGGLERLTEDPRMERSPVVGRSGMVFIAGDGRADAEAVRWLDWETAEIRTIDPVGWNRVGPDLSPDESRVCWTDKEDGHWESKIRVASIAGGGSSPVTRSAGRDDYCQFLDDRTVLFRSWRTGDQEIFRTGLRWWDRPVNLSRYGAEDIEPVVVGVTGR